MSDRFIGVVERRGFGIGAWALVADTGKVYELKNAPEALQQASMKVEITGQIKKDVMTLAMIGPVLEVESFKEIK